MEDEQTNTHEDETAWMAYTMLLLTVFLQSKIMKLQVFDKKSAQHNT
jgi:hypothetical protein